MIADAWPTLPAIEKIQQGSDCVIRKKVGYSSLTHIDLSIHIECCVRHFRAHYVPAQNVNCESYKVGIDFQIIFVL